MIKNETILASIYMIKDYKNGVHFLEETVDRVLNELKLLDAELEALKSRRCKGCRNLEDIGEVYRYCKELSIDISHSTESTFCCNRYEAQEQL